MKQNPKPSTRKPTTTIKIIDQYKDLFMLRERPVSKTFIERLASDLVQWAIDNDDALVLTQFLNSRKISSYTFYAWVRKFPNLERAKDVALESIGCRREIGALRQKLSVPMVMSQQAKYDPSWMKLERERAELKASLNEKHNPDIKYVIALEDFGEENKKPTNNLPETK